MICSKTPRSTLRQRGRSDPDDALKLILPADELTEAAAHHVLKLFPLQPRQFLSKEGHALPVAARHAGNVGAPKETLWPERVEDAVQPVLNISERIILRRIVRRPGRLHRDVRQLRQRHQFVEMDEGLGVTAVAVEPAMIDDHLQPWMALGDVAKFRQE